MTTTASIQRTTFASSEVADLLERVRDLVRLRRVFVSYGVEQADLRTCDAEIDSHRRRIAGLTRTASESLKAA